MANHKIATIQEIKVRKNDPKVRKIFQKTSKVGATICQFGWKKLKSAENGVKNPHKTIVSLKSAEKQNFQIV